MRKLDDNTLIAFVKKEYKNIPFISQDTADKYLNNFSVSSDQQNSKPTYKLTDIFNLSKNNHIDVLDFWEQLLIDAIKYLKWHDPGEFPSKKPMNRENAYDMISDGSLGIINLKEYFRVFIEFERLLYGAEQFYRDHVYHIIRVWLTGQFILKKYINSDFPICIAEDKYRLADVRANEKPSSRSSLSRKSNMSFFEGEEDAIWCIIALTHDLGYPLSKFEKINDRIKKMVSYFAKSGLEEFSFAFPLQNQFINDAILKYMSSKIVLRNNKRSSNSATSKYKTNIQAKYYLKFSRSFERFDHGLISCIVLTKNLIYFLETNYDWDPMHDLIGKTEARQFVLRREILRAIASHTCNEIYYLKPNTFSFLLLLSDELQFWGRPTFDTMATGAQKDYVVTLNKFDNKNVSFDIKITGAKDGTKKESLVGFFKSKVDLFKTVLRIAVDYRQREFSLKFKICDEANRTYEFESTPFKHPLLKIDGKEIKYDKLRKIAPILTDENKYKEIQSVYNEYKRSSSKFRGI
ncbi:MAG: hypothetical protein WC899_07210 [bacterium]|jgi:hypothetical protein